MLAGGLDTVEVLRAPDVRIEIPRIEKAQCTPFLVRLKSKPVISVTFCSSSRAIALESERPFLFFDPPSQISRWATQNAVVSRLEG